MDFARKILNKYGWKEGEGLGKHNNGIVKPLKASMKFDNAGLGSDQAASDFNNHWWERVFNEAAENVDVKTTKNGVSVDLKNKGESVEISTKEYSVKKLKKAKDESSKIDKRYDNFLQSATLTKSGDEIETPDKIAIADISVKKYKILTDEELFRACGGRTAHKGARHGLKLSGKLSRIEQQEQELLAKMEEEKNKSTKKPPAQCLENKINMNNIVSTDVPHKKQKKHKSKGVGHSGPTDLEVCNEINSITKVKKSKPKDIEITPTNIDLEKLTDLSETTTKVKKNKRKDNREQKSKTRDSITANTSLEIPEDANESTVRITVDSFDNQKPTTENKKLAKKNKKRNAGHMSGDETSNNTSTVTASVLKKKKKHQKIVLNK